MSRNIRGDKTRTEILEAAWKLISTFGADISVSKIAAAAGVSRQTIYLHFGSRGGLLVELVRWADDQFEIKENFDAALLVSDPKQRLCATLKAWLDFMPKIFPVAKDLIRLRAVDPEAAAAWADRMTDLRAWIFNFVATLEQDGCLQERWTTQKAAEFFWVQTSVQNWGLLTEDCGWSHHEAAQSIESVLVLSLLRNT